MGCVGSKQHDIESAKVSPLLRRRLEKIKGKHKNIVPIVVPTDTDSSSKKELLNKDNDSDDSLNSNDLRSQSSEGEILKVVPETQEKTRTEKEGIMCTKEANVKVEMPKLPSPPSDQAECKDIIDFSLQEKSVNPEEGVGSEDGEEKEENEEEFGMEERHVWPSSPSFREYLSETNNENENDDNHRGTDKEGDVVIVSQSTDDMTNKKSHSQETTESKDSNEGSVTKITKKRGQKGMKFKGILPKPKKVGAMKNLLIVKSCYSPACSGHDKTRLLEQSTTA